MISLLFLLWSLSNNAETMIPDSVKVLKEFEDAEDRHILSLPGSMDFGPDGSLFLVDQKDVRILVWDSQGSFKRAFGKEGQGPGEMNIPVKVAVYKDEVWVWCRDKKLQVFSIEGEFIRTYKIYDMWPKNIGIMDQDLAILGTEVYNFDHLAMQFYLLKNGQPKEIMSFKNDIIVASDGQNIQKSLVRAYADDMDIQRDRLGQWYIGFSGSPYLFKIDKKGEVKEKIELELPRLPITDQDIEYLKNASFPSWSGKRSRLENKGMTLSFDQPKTAYTQFTIIGDKAVFVVTPTGGYMTDLYTPCSHANYHVVDMKTGQISYSGSYRFPEDSMVFYRNGRILACVLNADEDYQVLEISLKGI